MCILKTAGVHEHEQLAALPDWPARTIAVLSTVDQVPHAIPVSAPLRVEDRRILLRPSQTARV